MGALGNPNHERFCQALHLRIWRGEKRSDALAPAYREAIYRGDDADDEALAPNARRMVARRDVKVRLQELADYAAKLAGIDSGWAQLKLRAIVEANLDDYLAPPDEKGDRYPAPLGSLSRDQLAFLGEFNQEERTDYNDEGNVKRTVRRMHVRVPSTTDKIGALNLAAKIGGWLAPEKTEHSVEQVTLEQLIMGSINRPSPAEPQTETTAQAPALPKTAYRL